MYTLLSIAKAHHASDLHITVGYGKVQDQRNTL